MVRCACFGLHFGELKRNTTFVIPAVLVGFSIESYCKYSQNTLILGRIIKLVCIILGPSFTEI